MTDEYLKPCPHCGAAASMRRRAGDYVYKSFVECNGCHAKTAFYADDLAAAIAWNRRADD